MEKERERERERYTNHEKLSPFKEKLSDERLTLTTEIWMPLLMILFFYRERGPFQESVDLLREREREREREKIQNCSRVINATTNCISRSRLVTSKA